VKAGSSKTCITPPLPVQLAGHRGERIGVEIGDDLWTRAIALQLGDKTVVLISNDLLWLEREQVARVRERIQAIAGVSAAHVLVACTHTHSGPDVLDWYDFAPPITDWWISSLIHTIASNACLAIRRLREVEMKIGLGTLPGAVNRRLPQGDKIVREPNSAGPVDRRLAVTAFRRCDGEFVGSIVHGALHPVVLGADSTVVSGDWCGTAMLNLEHRLGGCWLFFNGATGDNNPAVWSGRSYEVMQRVASDAAEACLAALSDASCVQQDLLDAVSHHAFFSYKPHPYLQRAQNRRVLRHGGLLVEVQRVEIGPLLLVGLGGECLSESGNYIRSASNVPELVLPVSYCNDYGGYLPLPHIYQEGGYEPSASMFDVAGAHAYLEAARALAATSRGT